jgi:cell wall-associated NlpC family hydrolase
MKQLILWMFLSISAIYAKHKDPLAHKLQHMVEHQKVENFGYTSKVAVVKTAKKYLGKKYIYGANSNRAVDCSSFVQQVYKKYKKKLPRTSRQQSHIGKYIPKNKLKPGDLVFFSSRKTKGVAHVGIYIGSGKFIHASSAKKKVVITKLSKKYYSIHFKGARRII